MGYQQIAQAVAWRLVWLKFVGGTNSYDHYNHRVNGGFLYAVGYAMNEGNGALGLVSYIQQSIQQ